MANQAASSLQIDEVEAFVSTRVSREPLGL
jgi:hypothetical protein